MDIPIADVTQYSSPGKGPLSIERFDSQSGSREKSGLWWWLPLRLWIVGHYYRQQSFPGRSKYTIERLQFAQEGYRRDDGQLEGKSKRDLRWLNKNWLVASWNTRAQLLNKGACKVRELDFFTVVREKNARAINTKKEFTFLALFFPYTRASLSFTTKAQFISIFLSVISV